MRIAIIWSISLMVMLPMSAKCTQPQGFEGKRGIERADGRLIDQRESAARLFTEQPTPGGLACVVVGKQARQIDEGVDVVDRRQHADKARRATSQGAGGLHVEVLQRCVAPPFRRRGPQPTRFGQFTDLIPLRDALGVDGLDRLPMPDDFKVVETLVVHIERVGLHRSLALCVDKIKYFEADVDAQIALCLLAQWLEERDFSAQHAQFWACRRLGDRTAR
ncbi:hypothetical protein ACVBEH_07875 [Roseateles sp. GG27B]